MHRNLAVILWQFNYGKNSFIVLILEEDKGATKERLKQNLKGTYLNGVKRLECLTSNYTYIPRDMSPACHCQDVFRFAFKTTSWDLLSFIESQTSSNQFLSLLISFQSKQNDPSEMWTNTTGQAQNDNHWSAPKVRPKIRSPNAEQKPQLLLQTVRCGFRKKKKD